MITYKLFFPIAIVFLSCFPHRSLVKLTNDLQEKQPNNTNRLCEKQLRINFTPANMANYYFEQTSLQIKQSHFTLWHRYNFLPADLSCSSKIKKMITTWCSLEKMQTLATAKQHCNLAQCPEKKLHECNYR